MITANLNGQALSLQYDEVVADSVRFLQIHFVFDSTWNNALKTAVFTNGSSTYYVAFVNGNSMYLGNNTCYVPKEVIKSPSFTVSIMGSVNGSVITSSVETVTVEQTESGGISNATPTPSLWAQLLEAFNAVGSIVDVDDVYAKISQKYTKPSGGIPSTDLASSVVESLTKADNSVSTSALNTALSAKYTKPSGGIPSTDLASSVVESLTKADNSVSTSALNTALSTKYTKPAGGIPSTDLASDVLALIEAAGDITVDTTYNSSSSNPQSGTAVASAISGLESASNKVTYISENSTHTQYPTAKCVYYLLGDINTVLYDLNDIMEGLI